MLAVGAVRKFAQLVPRVPAVGADLHIAVIVIGFDFEPLIKQQRGIIDGAQIDRRRDEGGACSILIVVVEVGPPDVWRRDRAGRSRFCRSAAFPFVPRPAVRPTIVAAAVEVVAEYRRRTHDRQLQLIGLGAFIVAVIRSGNHVIVGMIGLGCRIGKFRLRGSSDGRITGSRSGRAIDGVQLHVFIDRRGPGQFGASGKVDGAGQIGRCRRCDGVRCLQGQVVQVPASLLHGAVAAQSELQVNLLTGIVAQVQVLRFPAPARAGEFRQRYEGVVGIQGSDVHRAEIAPCFQVIPMFKRKQRPTRTIR
ncbi:hypothetical protein D3C74_250150 [compost metagenome]